MNKFLNRAGLALALILTCAVASIAAMSPATSPASPSALNVCGSPECICPANVDHTANPDIDPSCWVTRCGTNYGVGKNGCCRAEFPGLECEEKQCLFRLNYCAVGTPGTVLVWVFRLPTQTTAGAVAAGQYIVDGPATNVNTDLRLSCGQEWFFELWAYNPTCDPTTVMLDSFHFRCADCPLG